MGFLSAFKKKKKTYLQFSGDALALGHELRDYLGLLPQVLQLLRGRKKHTRITKQFISTQYASKSSRYNMLDVELQIQSSSPHSQEKFCSLQKKTISGASQ